WPGYRVVRAGETPTWQNLVLDPTLPEHALRAGAVVKASVNPSATVHVDYPEATPDCTVTRTPELEITKTASDERAEPGDAFSYRLEVTSTGYGATDDVTVSDPVPASLKVTG